MERTALVQARSGGARVLCGGRGRGEEELSHCQGSLEDGAFPVASGPNIVSQQRGLSTLTVL